jgi:hypothetical protein
VLATLAALIEKAKIFSKHQRFNLTGVGVLSLE